MKRIIFINDGAKYSNWGIQACSEGLKKILDITLEGADLRPLSHSWLHKKYAWDPMLMGRYLLNRESRVANRFIPEHLIYPKIADEFSHCARMWTRGEGGPGSSVFIREVENGAHAVVFNAEGSTYKNNAGAIKGLFLLWLAKKYYNIPSYFMNGSVSLTPVDSVLPAIARKVFGEIDSVIVREPKSELNISEFFPELRIHMAPDSAFQIQVRPDERLTKASVTKKPYFCFSLSMLPNDITKRGKESSLIKLIRKLQRLIPNSVMLAKDREDQILQLVARETKSSFVGANHDYNDIISILSNAEFLLSGRYHHLIFSCIAGCPSIPLRSSSHKNDGLAEMLSGIMCKAFDPTNLEENSDLIIKEAEKILNQRESLGQKCTLMAERLRIDSLRQGPVSYTHLTLPTILRV